MSEVDYVSERTGQAQYQEGRKTREQGQPSVACPHAFDTSASRQKRGWWLAGWHDRDIELGALIVKPKELSPRQLARKAGLTKYDSECKFHGAVQRWVASTKCCVCESVERKKRG